MKRAALALLLLLVAAAACGGGGTKDVRGIVVDMDGDLVAVSRFMVRTDEGDVIEFVPGPNVTFDDGTPLSHLREHQRELSPVIVSYQEADDGRLVVVGVEDG